MAESEGGEKKHEPGGRTLADAEARGQIARSADLATLAVVVAGGLVLANNLYGIVDPIAELARRVFAPPGALSTTDVLALWRATGWAVLVAAIQPLGAVALAATAVHLAQTRFGLAWANLEFDLSRLDPTNGIQRVFAPQQAAVELVKSVLKLLVPVLIVAWAMTARFADLPRAATLDVSQQIALLTDLGLSIVIYTCPALIVIAAADYGYSWWTVRESLMRTDQQVKDENKEQEGDPRMKATRMRRAREIVFSNAVRKLKEADVLVTNPTHFAVALRYRRGHDVAPVVVVKGMDHLALRLREEARRMGIPSIENRPLARGLYSRVKAGQLVPPDLYGPVARVLAVVLRRRQGRARR
jgi:flagellar biosynthetic protein FlhB